MKCDVNTRKEVYADVVLSSFQEFFERMTKELTASAPSAMQIKVVAPPDGNSIAVDAERFLFAEVLLQPSFTGK